MIAALHVLLVEDDELSALNTRRALRASPLVAAVTVAVDGRDAIELLLGGSLPAELLVITDLDMPRMSGLDLLAAIRGEPSLRHLRAVVLSMSSSDTDRRAALALDVEACFLKSSTATGDLLRWLGAEVPTITAPTATGP